MARTVYTIRLTDEAGEQTYIPGYFMFEADAQDALHELGKEFRAYHKRIVREDLFDEDDRDAA